MGYNPSYADPDVWIRPEINPGGFQYYGYILCYVDNVIYIPDDTGKYTSRIQEAFNLKYDNISEPDMYLGATISDM